MALFERFGEFDSVEELNMTAEGLKEEGDLESLKVLAVENGLDAADAEDYADGIVMELASDLMAAAGKIAVESKELGIDGIMSDWKDTVIEECAEDKAFCAAVRKKGKYLKEYKVLFGRVERCLHIKGLTAILPAQWEKERSSMSRE